MENDQTSGTVSARGANLLKRTVAKLNGQPAPDPIPVAKPVIPAVVESKPVVEVNDIELEYDIGESPTSGAAVTDPVVKEETKSGAADDISDLDIQPDPLGKTGEKLFKKLRTKLTHTLNEKKTLAEEREALAKKLEDYETGKNVPEVYENLQRRIEELEPLEKVMKLKSTPAYIEKFVTPVDEETAKLSQIAKDNSVDNEVLNAAFKAETDKEQNRILTQHFDDLTALEIKASFKKLKDINTQAQEAEKEPAKALARMQADSIRIKQEERQQANEAIINVSKDAWSESITSLQEDERFSFLNYREGDTEHNEKYVKPLRMKAGQEYGRLIKALTQHGLTELPKEVGVAVARMAKLAIASAALAHQNGELQTKVAELEHLIKTKSSLNRPSFSGVPGTTISTSSRPQAVGPMNAGRNVLNRVMGK